MGYDSKVAFSRGEITVQLTVVILTALTACNFPKWQCPFLCSVLASCFTAYLSPTLMLAIFLCRLISTLHLPSLAEN